MKKTVSVSIASTPFLVEEDAYRALDAYLSGVRTHFAGAKEEAEIVADIETRVAEQFVEAARKVIDLPTVEGVIASMGDARDFGDAGQRTDAAEAPSAAKPQDGPKRLYRNPDDKVIAGVASGLAAYLGIDVVVVRVAFVLLALLNGFGLLLYAALWISMPEARSASQRLEMTGKPVTLENLADRVKERVEEMKKDEGLFRRLVTVPFLIVGGVFTFLSRRVLPTIGRVFGLLVAVGSVFGLLSLSVAFGLLLTHAQPGRLDFPGSEAISPTVALGGAAAIYLTIAIPLLGLMSIGARLMGRRPTAGRSTSGAMAAVWALALVASTVIVITGAAAVSERAENSPEYRVQVRSVDVAPFNAVRALDGARVTFTESATASVSLEGSPYGMERVSVTVTDGVLSIEDGRIIERCIIFTCRFRATDVHVLVSGPGVAHFEASTGARLEASGVHDAEIRITEGSRGAFEVTGGSLNARASIGARLEVRGTATSAEFRLMDGSRLHASGLSVTDASITAEDGSRAEIGPTAALEARADGGSRIRYGGLPKLTRQATDGSRIEPIEAEEGPLP